jgi:hypothetical protein
VARCSEFIAAEKFALKTAGGFKKEQKKWGLDCHFDRSLTVMIDSGFNAWGLLAEL